MRRAAFRLRAQCPSVTEPFEIPPGGKRQRVLLMHPTHGDLKKLKVDGSEIQVNAGCSNNVK